jgi:peroxiredoxin
MIRKILNLLLLGCLLTVAPDYSFAQSGSPASKVEALKTLESLDPFKMTPTVGMSFDPKKGEELYFEDGKKISFEQFQTYVSRSERDYIVIPYVNPADREKIVAMLVRKATTEELGQMKALMATQSDSQKAYASEASDPSDPSSMEAIKFDPSLKAKDYIKGLKKMGESKETSMNIGRIAIFDVKGNLIPISEGKEAYDKYQKYMVTPEIVSDMYVDEDDVIRAQVFRDATMEERKKRQNIASSVFTESMSMGGDGGGATSGSAALAKGVKLPTNVPQMPADGFLSEGAKKKFGVGSEAKTFKAVDINGKEVDLASFKGKKTVVLNFWFTACKPCVNEMPELNKMMAEMKGKNVEFISICNDGAADVKDFLTKIKYDYRCIPDGLGIANQYNVLAFPTHVVINKKGDIALLQQGYSEGLIPQIKAEINKDQK